MKYICLLLIFIALQGFSMGEGNNIDWGFISSLEGNNLVGDVPDIEGSNSGVTIATGLDLGARKIEDLAGLPPHIIEAFTPYLQLKKQAAKNKLDKYPLTISEEDSKIVAAWTKKQEYNKLTTRWKKDTGTDFSTVPSHKATVIASVMYQMGTNAPNFWKQVTENKGTGNWDSAVINLRNFDGPGKDSRYQTRRDKEADYFLTRKDNSISGLQADSWVDKLIGAVSGR